MIVESHIRQEGDERSVDDRQKEIRMSKKQILTEKILFYFLLQLIVLDRIMDRQVSDGLAGASLQAHATPSFFSLSLSLSPPPPFSHSVYCRMQMSDFTSIIS